MDVGVYLLLGIALVGGLFYVLTQITARQRRLNAEITRLEQLAAEVSMNAEAILERVDERIDRLNQLAAQVEVQAVSRLLSSEDSLPAPEAVATEPVALPAATPKRKRSQKNRPAAEQPEAGQLVSPQPAAEEPGPAQRYQEVRMAVWAMADEGKDAIAIAQALSLPRGEVELLINLRSRKVNA